MTRPERWLAALLAAGLWASLLINATSFRAILINRRMMGLLAEQQRAVGTAQDALAQQQREAAARGRQAHEDREQILDLLMTAQTTRPPVDGSTGPIGSPAPRDGGPRPAGPR